MATSIFAAAEYDEELLTALQDGSIPHRHVERDFGFSDTAVRRWRDRHEISLNPKAPVAQAEEPDPKGIQGSIDETSTGAQVNNVVVTSPLNNDWSSVFSLFNMDASNFEVVDDTVRMKTWQQSKGTDDGLRDTIQLYSYSARFRKVDATRVLPWIVDQWRATLISEPLQRLDHVTGDGTYVMLIADPQLGKKGTEEAMENWKRGIRAHVSAAYRLNPEAVHLAFMGDEHEGVANNYTNQSHTVELNFTKQLELDFDMRVWSIREVARLGLPVSGSSVISNHGEWTRNGSKDVVTTKGDNSSTYIARQVAKMFDELAPHNGLSIDWTIADGDPAVIVDLSGVKAYFSHGYIEKGRGGSTEIRTKNAIENQILGKTEEFGDIPLFFMAHYHHFYSNTFADRTLFGCPALEATKSSEYMLDQYGVWSPAGMLGLLVGRDDLYWSDLAVY